MEAAHSFIRYGELQASWPLLAGLLFVVFIAALVAYMLVLFPAHNPELGKGSPRGNAARDVYFVPDPRALSAEDLVQAVASADHAHNLAHEVLKLAAIRNSKRRRYIGALCLTFVFYALLFVGRFAG